MGTAAPRRRVARAHKHTHAVDSPVPRPTTHFPHPDPGVLLGTIMLITELCERSPAALKHFRKVGWRRGGPRARKKRAVGLEWG